MKKNQKEIAEPCDYRIQRIRLHELYLSRLSGNFKTKGIIVLDSQERMNLLIDDGHTLALNNFKVRADDKLLSTLAFFIKNFRLKLMDNELIAKDIKLSSTEAEQYLKESGMCVADSKGMVYRFNGQNIVTGEKVIPVLPESEEFLAEHTLLLFSTLDVKTFKDKDELPDNGYIQIPHSFIACNPDGVLFEYSQNQQGIVCLKSEDIFIAQKQEQEAIAFIAMTMDKFNLKIESNGKLVNLLVNASTLNRWRKLFNEEKNIIVSDTNGTIYESWDNRTELWCRKTGKFYIDFPDDVMYLCSWHLKHTLKGGDSENE